MIEVAIFGAVGLFSVLTDKKRCCLVKDFVHCLC